MRNVSLEVFTVTDITYGESKNNEEMFTIELTDIMNDEIFQTYVVKDHKNYKNWQRIIDHPDRFYFLTNLKLKEIKRGPNAGNYYINGDSRVEIQHETSDHTRYEKLIYEMKGIALPLYLRKDLFQ